MLHTCWHTVVKLNTIASDVFFLWSTASYLNVAEMHHHEPRAILQKPVALAGLGKFYKVTSGQSHQLDLRIASVNGYY